MAEREIDSGFDPFPALVAQRLRFPRELFRNQPVEQRHILQPTAIVVFEQIAGDDAARRLIGIEPDKLRPLVGGAYRALGELAADGPGLLVVGMRERVPDLLLARMVVS